MVGKRAFYDPTTRILKCWGFVETNTPGDLFRDVPEDYNTPIGTVTLNAAGDGDEPVPPAAPPTLEEQANRAFDAIPATLRLLFGVATGWTPAELRKHFVDAYVAAPPGP